MIIERDFIQLARRHARIEGDAPTSGFIYSEAGLFDDETSNIAFTRLGWTNPGLLIPRGDVQAVAYSIDEESKTLLRNHFNFVDAVAGEEPKKRPMVTGVSKMTFEFFDGEKWQPKAGSTIPAAIAITLELDDLGIIQRKFLLPGGKA